jgi:cell division protein FtsI (penicillin-binding protein 3)
MALDVGTTRQKAFLDKLGLLTPIDIEIPEKAAPQFPAEWKEINTVTISYGHGISVSPLHLVRGIGTLVSGGTLEKLTLLKDGNKAHPVGARVVSEQTSRNICRLMRLVVDHGTGSKADVPGYHVAGKTGTAEKISASGHYEAHANISSFIATFPMDNPRYVVLIMLDEPKGDKSTFGFVTGGWVSAPAVGRVIARMGPLLGIKPVFDMPADDAEKFWVGDEKPKVQTTGSPMLEKKYLHAASF